MAVKLGNGQWAVKENNLLAYNDNSGQFFNKEFDFTRGSSATYVGKDGLIKTAGLQDTNLVQNGDFSQLGSELVTNGDFATDSNWTKGADTIIESGKLVINNQTSGAIQTSQSNVVTVGKFYKVVFTISDYTSGQFRLFNTFDDLTIYNSNGTYTVYAKAYLSPTLSLYSNANSQYSIDNVSVKQVDPNDEWNLGSGWSYGDGVAYSDNTQTNYESLQQSSVTTIGKTYELKFNLNLDSGVIQAKGNAVYETYYPADNGEVVSYFVADSTFFRFTSFPNNTLGSITNISVQEIQVNTPRIDFSDSADGALLLEPQSTNLLPYSEDFSQWSKYDLTVGQNATTSPNGLLNAVKLIENSSNSTHLAWLQATTISATHSFSIFAKVGERKRIALRDNQAGNSAVFDLESGSVVSGSGGSIVYFGNGFYRITLKGNYASAGTRHEIYILPDNATTATTSYQGDGSSGVYIWGAQLEQLPYATSYIPTQGSASTRIVETCTNSGSAQDFNSEEGVLYAEIAALSNVTSLKSLSLSDGTNSNRITIGLDNNNYYCQIRKQGSAVFATGGVLTNIKLFNKIAIYYAENNFALWINGIKVSTDTSGLTPIGLNKLNFNLAAGAYKFYGKTKNIQVFTTALSDEELEKLTTI